jgi:hypothetical protein
MSVFGLNGVVEALEANAFSQMVGSPFKPGFGLSGVVPSIK